jgi:membrane protein required for colicin V production
MNVLDWILIILFAVGGFWGYKSGLITGALTVIALFVASIISGQFSERLVGIISNSVEGEALSTAIAYVAIFVVIFILAGMLAKGIKAGLKVVLLGWVDKVGGIALGIVAGVIIIGAVVGFSARATYLVEDKDQVHSEDVLKQMARQFAASAAREAVDGFLKGSSVTGVVVDIYRYLPANALGMLPGDFDVAFEVLDERRKIDS